MLMQSLFTSGTALACLALPGGESKPDAAPGEELLEAELIFELNATDGDAEVVLELNADVGLDRLAVYNPLGKSILRLASTDGEDLGLSEVLLESAEPDVTSVIQAYPEGTYRILARLVGHGGWVSTEAELSHDLLSAPVILSPSAGQTVSASGAIVTWQGDPGAAAWIIEIEQDELEIGMTVLVPGDFTSFAIPDGFLVNGEEFELGIQAENEDGNVIVTETTFCVE